MDLLQELSHEVTEQFRPFRKVLFLSFTLTGLDSGWFCAIWRDLPDGHDEENFIAKKKDIGPFRDSYTLHLIAPIANQDIPLTNRVWNKAPGKDNHLGYETNAYITLFD